MSWLHQLSEMKIDFRGSTLISVRKECVSEIHTILCYGFRRSPIDQDFSLNIGKNMSDMSTKSVSFNPDNWDGELLNNMFFFKRRRPDPTHRGDWPHPDSDLYILVLS